MDALCLPLYFSNLIECKADVSSIIDLVLVKFIIALIVHCLILIRTRVSDSLTNIAWLALRLTISNLDII
jgi:hypothetical protein